MEDGRDNYADILEVRLTRFDDSAKSEEWCSLRRGCRFRHQFANLSQREEGVEGGIERSWVTEDRHGGLWRRDKILCARPAGEKKDGALCRSFFISFWMATYIFEIGPTRRGRRRESGAQRGSRASPDHSVARLDSMVLPSAFLRAAHTRSDCFFCSAAYHAAKYEKQKITCACNSHLAREAERDGGGDRRVRQQV